MKLISLVFVCFVVQQIIANDHSSVQLCNHDDGKCIGKASVDFINLNEKNKENIGIPRLDPLQINNLSIRRSGTGPFSLDLTLSNVDITGLSKLSFEKVIGFTKDVHNSKLELYGTIPHLYIKGQYKVNGKVFILPILGNGDVSVVVDEMRIAFKLKPKILMVDGFEHVQVDKLKIKLDPQNLKIQLTNLFNGDVQLGSRMNSFLNSNWRDVWEEISPAVNNGMTEIITNVVNNILKKYSYQEIFGS